MLLAMFASELWSVIASSLMPIFTAAPAGLKQIVDLLDAHAHAHHADFTQFLNAPISTY
jgi:hypothetical protein